MTGLVVWWPYAIVDIPNGWALCDGVDGRPDYRNYVLIGAGDLYTPGQVLGALTHLHTGDADVHTDTVEGATDSEVDCLADGADVPSSDGSPVYDRCTEGHPHNLSLTTDGHPHTLTINLANHLPPAKAGCWVIKL